MRIQPASGLFINRCPRRHVSPLEAREATEELRMPLWGILAHEGEVGQGRPIHHPKHRSRRVAGWSIPQAYTSPKVLCSL